MLSRYDQISRDLQHPRFNSGVFNLPGRVVGNNFNYFCFLSDDLPLLGENSF